jgi:RNA polymerase sigma-19 factor, ECF subfamily
VSKPEDFLTRLFAESHRALRRYVRGLVGSREKAEDIVQEAYLRTYEHKETVVTPRAFLFSAARNLAIDARRHARIAKTDSVGDVEAVGVVSFGTTPEDQALDDERAQLLRQAIERLPPQCRAAFALKVFHACSYQEIATRLGITEKTVEKHVSRGIRDTYAYLKRQYRGAGVKP